MVITFCRQDKIWWNLPLNVDTEGSYYRVHIVLVSVLRGLLEKNITGTCFTDLKTRADILKFFSGTLFSEVLALLKNKPHGDLYVSSICLEIQ